VFLGGPGRNQPGPGIPEALWGNLFNF